MGPARHEIIYQPSAALRPLARNARTHSKKQVRQIADIIEGSGVPSRCWSTTPARLLPAMGGWWRRS